jgi:hypothetical protein
VRYYDRIVFKSCISKEKRDDHLRIHFSSKISSANLIIRNYYKRVKNRVKLVEFRFYSEELPLYLYRLT